MFKFSLRDLFWLTVVAAILCGWWLQYRREQEASAKLTFEKERLQLNWRLAEIDKAAMEAVHAAEIAGIKATLAGDELQAARERWKVFESMGEGATEVVPGVAAEVPPSESVR